MKLNRLVDILYDDKSELYRCILKTILKTLDKLDYDYELRKDHIEVNEGLSDEDVIKLIREVERKCSCLVTRESEGVYLATRDNMKVRIEIERGVGEVLVADPYFPHEIDLAYDDIAPFTRIYLSE